MDFKISIIMAIHNVEEYLDEAIDSLKCQTIGFENIEVLMIDDGSTDNSWNKMLDFKNLFNNIKLFQRKEKSGACGAPRNIGIENATGEYLMFLDPDDKLVSNACELLISAAEKYNSDLVIGMYEQFNSTTRWLPDIFNHRLSSKLVNVKVEDYPNLMLAPPAVPTKLHRTKMIQDNHIRFPEYIIGEDASFAAEVLFQSEKITFIPKVVYEYRAREDSVTQDVKLKFFRDYNITRKIILEIYERFNRMNYFEIRYIADLRYFYNQLNYMSENNQEEKLEALKELQWFAKLYSEHGLIEGDLFFRLLTIQIGQGEYEEALKTLKHMNEVYLIPSKNAVQKETHYYKSKCDEILLSRSWKITKPLRSAGYLCRRIVKRR